MNVSRIWFGTLMNPLTDFPLSLAALNFAIAGVLAAAVLLAVDYFGRPNWARRVTLLLGGFVLAAALAGAFLRGPLDLVLPGAILGATLLAIFAAGSGLFERLSRLAARPIVLHSALLALSVATLFWAQAVAHSPADETDALSLLAMGSDYHSIPDFVAVTDLGSTLPLVRYDADERLGDSEQCFLADSRFAHQIIRIAEPTADCNCHGWVYTGGRYAIQGCYVPELLADNGYVEVKEPRTHDLVIYRGSGGSVDHTGVVRHVGDDDLVLVESKWGPLGVYVHPLESQPYGQEHKFYRSSRRGHLLSVVPSSSVPALDGPALARSLNQLPSGAAGQPAAEHKPHRREIYERPILRVPGQRRT